jgi:hypothetical protein
MSASLKSMAKAAAVAAAGTVGQLLVKQLRSHLGLGASGQLAVKMKTGKHQRKSGKTRRGPPTRMGGRDERTALAPEAFGSVTRRKGPVMSRTGRALPCRYLGTGISSTRVSGSEISNISIIVQSTAGTGTYALNYQGTNSGDINLGPAEIGPLRLLEEAEVWQFYAIRYLRVRFRTSTTVAANVAGIQTALGIIESQSVTVNATSGNLNSFQETDALENSMNFIAWENCEFSLSRNGEKLFNTTNTASVGPTDRFQFALVGYTDAIFGTSGSIVLGYLEFDYICDFYGAMPYFGSGDTPTQRIRPERPRVVVGSDGLRRIDSVASVSDDHKSNSSPLKEEVKEFMPVLVAPQTPLEYHVVTEMTQNDGTSQKFYTNGSVSSSGSSSLPSTHEVSRPSSSSSLVQRFIGR